MPTRTDPIIDLLAIGNLDGALALSASAGWNQRLDDWRMLLRLAPAGSFAAIAEGRVVGTAIGIDYGGFGWIAMMLVDSAYRGRGVGRRLLEAAMGAVPSDRPIRLDATPLGRPLYQRYGFEDEAMLTRHVVSATTPRNQPSHVRPLTAADLQTVIGQDDEVFGGNAARCSSGLSTTPRSMATWSRAVRDSRTIVSAARAAFSIRSDRWLQATTTSPRHS